MSPLTKYDTIAPNLEINEIRPDIDPDVHADSEHGVSIGKKLINFTSLSPALTCTV